MKTIILLLLIIPSITFGQLKNVELVSFKSSSCDKDADIFRLQRRIVSQNIKGDLFKLSIGVIANCAGIHNVTVTSKFDTLAINYEDGKVVYNKADNKKSGTLVEKASCDCCFEFDFIIKGLTSLPNIITVNGSVIRHFSEKYKVYEVKYTIKNGDTINLIDRDGFKQGKWYESKENNGYFLGHYFNDQLKIAESKEYYSNGKLKSVLVQKDFKKFKLENYFDNGMLSLQILGNDSLGTISTSFYEDGRIKRTYVDANNYSEEKLFYPNGNIKKVTGNYIHQDYYLSGSLRKEFSFIGDHEIFYRYYYPEGELMATHKVNRDKNISIWNYYDRNNKITTKQLLSKQGFIVEE